MTEIVEFRVVRPEDEEILVELFQGISDPFFQPHPFTAAAARGIATRRGRDIYAILIANDQPVGYGILRGWDEGYEVPSLGVAVRNEAQGQGFGRLTMIHLHAEAARRGARLVRLRVHPDNLRARRLYKSLGYSYAGEERGEMVMVLALDQYAPGESPRDRQP